MHLSRCMFEFIHSCFVIFTFLATPFFIGYLFVIFVCFQKTTKVTLTFLFIQNPEQRKRSLGLYILIKEQLCKRFLRFQLSKQLYTDEETEKDHALLYICNIFVMIPILEFFFAFFLTSQVIRQIIKKLLYKVIPLF